MSKDSKAARIVAACTACGAISAAHYRTDGQIRPIGSPDGCRCGGTDFVEVDEDNDDSAPT